VIPARLFGRRAGVHSQPPSRATKAEHLTGKVEIFLTREGRCRDLGSARPARPQDAGRLSGFSLATANSRPKFSRAASPAWARCVFISHDQWSISQHFERLGHVPLPPYIERDDETSDRERYQTVFAKRPGAIAAPTAGLHFSTEILEKIRARGVEIRELTLNVGLGTFQPIHGETLEGHVMHSESYEIPDETAERLQAARAAGRPILAIGTTVVRALEDAAWRATNQALRNSYFPARPKRACLSCPDFSSVSWKACSQLSLTAFHAAGAGLRLRRPRTRPGGLRARSQCRLSFLQLWRLHAGSLVRGERRLRIRDELARAQRKKMQQPTNGGHRILPLQELPRPAERQEGRPHRSAASLSSFEKESRTLFDYSLKMNTRAWPAKRTSFTCPFSPISTES